MSFYNPFQNYYGYPNPYQNNIQQVQPQMQPQIQLVKKLHKAGFDSAKRISLTSVKPKAVIDGVTQEEVFSLITDYSGKGKFGKQETKESERHQAYLCLVVKAGLDAGVLEYTESNTLKLRIRVFCEVVPVKYCCISGDVNL